MRAALVTAAGTLAAVTLALSGCTVASTQRADRESSVSTPSPSQSVPPILPPPTPTPLAWPDDAEREAAFQTEIAAWPHPIPPGYSWPKTWSDLPFLGGHTSQQFAYLTAEGIYHCMSVGAAWDAYFTDNDAVASKHYAGLADEFAPDHESVRRVTSDDGTVIADALAAESGICRGFVGDLTS